MLKVKNLTAQPQILNNVVGGYIPASAIVDVEDEDNGGLSWLDLQRDLDFYRYVEDKVLTLVSADGNEFTTNEVLKAIKDGQNPYYKVSQLDVEQFAEDIRDPKVENIVSVVQLDDAPDRAYPKYYQDYNGSRWSRSFSKDDLESLFSKSIKFVPNPEICDLLGPNIVLPANNSSDKVFIMFDAVACDYTSDELTSSKSFRYDISEYTALVPFVYKFNEDVYTPSVTPPADIAIVQDSSTNIQGVSDVAGFALRYKEDASKTYPNYGDLIGFRYLKPDGGTSLDPAEAQQLWNVSKKVEIDYFIGSARRGYVDIKESGENAVFVSDVTSPYFVLECKLKSNLSYDKKLFMWSNACNGADISFPIIPVSTAGSYKSLQDIAEVDSHSALPIDQKRSRFVFEPGILESGNPPELKIVQDINSQRISTKDDGYVWQSIAGGSYELVDKGRGQWFAVGKTLAEIQAMPGVYDGATAITDTKTIIQYTNGAWA